MFRALSIHPLKAEIWIKASTWEWKNRGKISAARCLMQKALRHLPESIDIWLNFFELEADYASKVLLRSSTLGIQEQNIPSALMKLEIPSLIHKNALNRLPIVVDDQAQFINKAKSFGHLFTGLVGNLLINLYENEKYVSNVHIVGLIIQNLTSESSLTISDVMSSFMKFTLDPSSTSYTKESLELAIFQFTKILHVDDLQSDVKILLADKIDQLYQYAEKTGLISPEMYSRWIELNEELDMDNSDLVNAALKSFPTSNLIIAAYLNSNLRKELVNFSGLVSMIKTLPSNSPVLIKVLDRLLVFIEKGVVDVELLKVIFTFFRPLIKSCSN